MAILVLSFQLALYQHLRCDAGMISTHLPEGIVTLHAVIANQGIHDSVLVGMTHVQATSHIGRRDHDAIRLLTTARSKVITFFPGFVPALFDGVGVISLIHGIVFVFYKELSGDYTGDSRLAVTQAPHRT